MSAAVTNPPVRAFQWDLARQLERMDWLVAQFPRYADWGYQEVYLHLEDAVDYPSLPGVARRGAYSYRQFERLVAAATRAGVRVVPIVNLLGHTQYLVKVPGLRDLNECRAPEGTPLPQGQICPVHPRTLNVAEKLLRDMAPFCTAGKVHVGLDESYHLGRHPLSRAEIAEVGLAGHFARYVGRLHGLTQGMGLRLGLWADLLALLPAAISQLPAGLIAYDWYYYPFRRLPRAELHNFADYDLSGPLRARGIDYWGCPMNGAFRHEAMPVFGERLENIRSWWRRCQTVGAGGMLVSSWEPNRLALELTTVVDAAAASLWLEPGEVGNEAMLAQGFRRVFGPKRARPAARAALAGDERAFVGCARWEIDTRWDVRAGREEIGIFRNERAFFTRLAERSRLPPPQSVSVWFCRYQAVREVFVRENAQKIFRLRRAGAARPQALGRLKSGLAQLLTRSEAFAAELKLGRAAAQVMWGLTRDTRVKGPNQQVLDRDEQRLARWQKWLGRAARKPNLIWGETPVCGAWQLRCVVHNFAPAVQRVVVEQLGADGSWKVLHGRNTIEFRAFAARPRANISREFNVPISDPGAPLRLAVRGVGQVAFSRIELTDGVKEWPALGWPSRRRKILGQPAPRRGFPELNWTTNRGVLRLRFSRTCTEVKRD